MLVFFLQQILTSLWACETPGLGNICLLVSSDWTVQPALNPACLVYYVLTGNSTVKSGELFVHCRSPAMLHWPGERWCVPGSSSGSQQRCLIDLSMDSTALQGTVPLTLEGKVVNQTRNEVTVHRMCSYHSEFKYLFHQSVPVFKYLTKYSAFQQKHDTQT